MRENAWAIEVIDGDKQKADIRQKERMKWERRCIYKLPACVTDLNKNAYKPNPYKPRAVSFGPYHHGDLNLEALEDHKARALRHFLERSKKTPQDYFSALNGVLQDLKDAYDSPNHILLQNKDEFLQLMIRDGCFMLEILRTFTPRKNEDSDYADNDPIFSNHGKLYMMPYMKRDMLMLENQLPLLGLDKLLAVENSEIQDEEFINGLVLKFCFPQFHDDDIKNMRLGKCLHVLDVYRKGLLWKKPPGHKASLVNKIGTILGCGGGVSSSSSAGGLDSSAGGIGGVGGGAVGSGSAGGSSVRNSGGDEATKLQEVGKKKTRSLKDIICGGGISAGGGLARYEIIRSATELHEAGIRFKKSKTDSLKDITFEGGILTLPSIEVDDATEPMFLNLIAFERFHVGAGNEVTAYISFMDNIIENAKDISLLHSCGIIQNAMGSDKAAARLFNSLSTDVTLDPDVRLRRVQGKVNEYSKKSWNKFRANLIHTYFQSPWASISLIAAIFLFALTIVQTIYTVVQYYQS